MNSPDPCAPLKPLDVEDVAPNTNPCWSVLAVLRQQWQQILTRLAQAQEVHVWQRTDRAGRLYWQAYDPATGRSTAGSEADIRAWIEQLHYLKQ